MAYAVGQGGCLTRCDATAFPRGGLMGLSDRCTGAIPRIDTLCRTIVAECVKRGFQGVLADFETNPYSDRLSFLSRLSARLSARGMALYCPLSLPAEGAMLLVGTGLSGGSLRALLEETACRYGAERLALDLERVMMDFPLPCPSGCGTPLTREELLALREKHPSSVYFSRELMAKYFTYSAGSGTHFVLFDDAETLRQKVKLAQNLGIQTAFLMFPEIVDRHPELCAARCAAGGIAAPQALHGAKGAILFCEREWPPLNPPRERFCHCKRAARRAAMLADCTFCVRQSRICPCYTT